jgi:hypothetical protein
MPPPRRALSWLEPVVMQMSSERRMWNSVAVVKPIGTSLEATVNDVCACGIPSQIIFSAFASEMPLISWICRFGLHVRGRELGSRRVGDSFDSMIASFEELFDVARRDPIALTVRANMAAAAHLETTDWEGASGGIFIFHRLFGHGGHCVGDRMVCGGKLSGMDEEKAVEVLCVVGDSP